MNSSFSIYAKYSFLNKKQGSVPFCSRNLVLRTYLLKKRTYQLFLTLLFLFYKKEGEECSAFLPFYSCYCYYFGSNPIRRRKYSRPFLPIFSFGCLSAGASGPFVKKFFSTKRMSVSSTTPS